MVSNEDEPAGALRIGAVPTTITGVLPSILVGASRTYPRLEIGIAPGRSPNLYGKVIDGDLGAAIIVEPS